MLYLNSDFENLIDSLKVMTIAISWENGVWSAPVYYLYKHRVFYFFSSPYSRHIIGVKMFPEKSVAASIYKDDSDFNKIKGVQMRGKIQEIGKSDDAKEVLSAASSYAIKFALPLKWSNMEEALSCFKKSYRAHFYKFIPSEVIYMDNSVSIGFKRQVSISTLLNSIHQSSIIEDPQ